ncbi:protein-methionine-sulfoxide reductase heme-binding subunit MsrQ [Frigidibacter sp. RF13]|uniref:protein-methionine-sulfoxide reductase heme-binding subunit MsrQ n=1 Tax=Frigidibacter sp. RF13 TaxID=2997340 RepID=UPI002271F43B|nr:protein-methionine-sulfoxide reductase heme-binding subunit MsrQ [Frigidibacter sp. RF13]MCY1128767.1 protein-methionine-sulfoxide reductase heme-binding subunit MsrQ [Frigidibacter sp. RF13]
MGPVQRINGWLRAVPAWTLYVAGALPPAWLFYLAAIGRLGADPVKGLERQMGEWALMLMVAVLAVTPLRRFLGLNLLKFRRAMGLLAFFYVLGHFLVWALLDMGLLWSQILADIVKRPYVTIGMAGLLMLVPLAVTSNNRSIRRLGAARWQKLHRLTYPAALAGAVHYIWLVKSWPLEPFVYLALILLLLAARLKLPTGTAVRVPAAKAGRL